MKERKDTEHWFSVGGKGVYREQWFSVREKGVHTGHWCSVGGKGVQNIGLVL